jgi:hypothetical protein
MHRLPFPRHVCACTAAVISISTSPASYQLAACKAHDHVLLFLQAKLKVRAYTNHARNSDLPGPLRYRALLPPDGLPDHILLAARTSAGFWIDYKADCDLVLRLTGYRQLAPAL